MPRLAPLQMARTTTYLSCRPFHIWPLHTTATHASTTDENETGIVEPQHPLPIFLGQSPREELNCMSESDSRALVLSAREKGRILLIYVCIAAATVLGVAASMLVGS